MEKKINIFSFFAGAGFLDLGFEMSGHYNVVYVNEYHKAFNDIYRHARVKMGISKPIYGNHVEDITSLLETDKMADLKKKIEESRKQALTGFIGGPPCPDFSVAGKNKGKKGENGKLSGTYAEIICRTLPDFFLFENVKGLYRTTKHRKFFEQLKNKFKRAGYNLTEQLINSLEFGAPQDRERIILVGIHRNVVNALDLKTKGKCLEGFDWDKNKLYSKKEIASANWPRETEYCEDKLLDMPSGILEKLTVEYWWRKNDVLHHPNAKMYFKPKAGLVRFQTIAEGDDKKKCFKRLHRWRYSPTAAYGNNEVHIHPYKSRRISVAEALAIQSLPKEFEIPDGISLSDAFKTIGNGVPYMAALGIAHNIYDYISHSK